MEHVKLVGGFLPIWENLSQNEMAIFPNFPGWKFKKKYLNNHHLVSLEGLKPIITNQGLVTLGWFYGRTPPLLFSIQWAEVQGEWPGVIVFLQRELQPISVPGNDTTLR